LFAKNFAKTGMRAYVELIQRREREIGCDVLTHQKVCRVLCILLCTTSNCVKQWSGADYADNLIKTVTGGVSSTAAMAKGVTEAQFGTKL
jgi:isocitrate lyase